MRAKRRMPPDDVLPPLSRGRAWALALIATLTMAVSYIDRQTLSAIAPSVQKALHFDDAAYGYLGVAFALAYLVGAPVAGAIVDRVGARRGLLGAVLMWSAIAAVHAVAPGFGVLLTMRVLLGLAESPSFPAAAQTIQRGLPPADHARGFGVLFTGSSIGAAIAPPLATWLADRYDYRAAFLGTAAAGLLWIPLWLAVAFRGPARRALDLRHAAAPVRAPSLVPFALAKHSAVQRSVMAVLASAPLLTFSHQWGTKFLVQDHGITQRAAGALLWAPPLFFDVGAIAFGHLASVARARGAEGVPRPLLAVAAALMLGGLAVPFAPTPALAVVALCVALCGGGGMYALPMADLAVRVAPWQVASAGGLCAAAQSVAQVVTNPLLGHAVKGTGSYTLAIVGLSLWVIPGSVAWLAWRPPPPYIDGALS